MKVIFEAGPKLILSQILTHSTCSDALDANHQWWYGGKMVARQNFLSVQSLAYALPLLPLLYIYIILKGIYAV